jgi:integrase/recombinase XerC
VHGDPNTAAAEVDPFPGWFSDFLNDRQTRKLRHTIKACRQDFIAIATLVAGGDPSHVAVADMSP